MQLNGDSRERPVESCQERSFPPASHPLLWRPEMRHQSKWIKFRKPFTESDQAQVAKR